MSDKPETTPRCGDQVLHKPSGETWVVAYADPVTNDLAWAGWPNGLARMSDCEIVKRCTDEEHKREIDRWRESRDEGADRRHSKVLAFYGGEHAEA